MATAGRRPWRPAHRRHGMAIAVGGVLAAVAADVAVALARMRRTTVVRVVDRATERHVDEPRPASEQVQIALVWTTLLGSRVLARSPRFLRSLERLSVRKGEAMDRPAAAGDVARFVADYDVDVRDLDRRPEEFDTLNEFFARPLRPGTRPLAEPDDPRVAVCPADGRLTSVEASGTDGLLVKGRRRSVADLLGLPTLAPDQGTRVRAFHDDGRSTGFSAVICRLAPADYHRFHWPVDGEWQHEESLDLPGEYHSVAPACVAGVVDVLGRNRRVVAVVGTRAFGEVAVVAVGAVKVGSVALTAASGPVAKGDEMGLFRYGGSTVVVVFRQGVIRIEPDLAANSARGYETLVRMGSALGRATS